MSIRLEIGSEPEGLEVLSFGSGVLVGGYKFSLEDFFLAAEYVLTNTDLEPDDPRLRFVECVQSMKRVDGFNQGKVRLETPRPLTFP